MANLLDLPKELEDIARNELNEVPNRVNEDIAHIREWLLKQPHINAPTDASTLLIFLRSCKFSLEKTKRKLDLFYTAKSAFPELFSNRDPYQKAIRYLSKNKMLSIFSRSSTGPVIIVTRLGKLDIDMTSLNDTLKLHLMAFEVALRSHVNTSVAGIVLVFDTKDMSMKYLLQLTPQMLKKTALCFENVYPLRIKAFVIVNLSPVLFYALDLFKSFLSEKLRNRVFSHVADSQTSITQLFDYNLLPKEFGGVLGSAEDFTDQFNLNLESFHDWFMKDEQYRSSEDTKVLSSKLNIDEFSLEGSFRQLEVD